MILLPGCFLKTFTNIIFFIAILCIYIPFLHVSSFIHRYLLRSASCNKVAACQPLLKSYFIWFDWSSVTGTRYSLRQFLWDFSNTSIITVGWIKFIVSDMSTSQKELWTRRDSCTWPTLLSRQTSLMCGIANCILWFIFANCYQHDCLQRNRC